MSLRQLGLNLKMEVRTGDKDFGTTGDIDYTEKLIYVWGFKKKGGSECYSQENTNSGFGPWKDMRIS